MSKLLVVEDEQHQRELYAMELEDEGYEVDQAGNGREAVDHEWVAPQDLLDRRKRGEAKLMFPTRLNLEVLARSPNAAAAVTAARAQKVVTVEPRVEDRADGKVLIIPAEAGYGLTEERMKEVMG